jgi:hypothetical protein
MQSLPPGASHANRVSAGAAFAFSLLPFLSAGRAIYPRGCRPRPCGWVTKRSSTCSRAQDNRLPGAGTALRARQTNPPHPCESPCGRYAALSAHYTDGRSGASRQIRFEAFDQTNCRIVSRSRKGAKAPGRWRHGNCMGSPGDARTSLDSFEPNRPDTPYTYPSYGGDISAEATTPPGPFGQC